MNDKSLKQILKERDQFEIDDPQWHILNEEKSEWLEEHKPSTREEIIYFNEFALINIPKGFSIQKRLPRIPFSTEKRSLLEYNPETRHPIPYAIVKYEDYYFFTLRKKESGEMRLIGLKGLLGGHVSKEDVDPFSLNKSLLRGLKREIREEAGITMDLITSVNLKGLIKSDEGVDRDHLGVVFELELKSQDIRSQETGKLQGMWIHRKDLIRHYDSMESWSKIVYDNIISQGI